MSKFSKKVRYEVGSDVWYEMVHFPCGKCPSCIQRRSMQWQFRLLQEEKVSLSAYFITLTFNTKSVPLSKKGLMTLVGTESKMVKGKWKRLPHEKSVSAFVKRLRHYEAKTANFLFADEELPIKYYAVGEYGKRTKRPHFHLAIFNIKDPENIHRAWSFGDIDVGRVEPGSAAYVCKYLHKEHSIPMWKGDDRLPEYSRMSNGLGEAYLTENVKTWYRRDLRRNFVKLPGGAKVPLPKFYVDRIFPKGDPISYERTMNMRKVIEQSIEDRYQENYKEYYRDYWHREDYSFEQYLNNLREGKQLLYQKKIQNERNTI